MGKLWTRFVFLGLNIWQIMDQVYFLEITIWKTAIQVCFVLANC
jgi:hypothetical protein